MKLTEKALEDLVSEITPDKDAIKLVKILKNKQNISEFVLADKLKINVNRVRSLLYSLQDYNLVSFIRKKDKEKGWYIYYWAFNNNRAREVLIKIKKEKLYALKEQLEKESQSSFFVCPDGCMRLDFESSMELGYKCRECGQVLIKEDNTLKIDTIKKQIEVMEKELARKPVIIRKIKKKVKKKPIKIKKKKIFRKVKKKKKVKKPEKKKVKRKKLRKIKSKTRKKH